MKADNTGEYDDLKGPRVPRQPSDEEIRVQARIVFWRRIGLTLAGLAGILAFAGIGYTVVAIRAQQVANAPVTESTNQAATSASAAAKRIEDCTTPGRDCYERGQGQITSAVVDVNRVTVIAAACADLSDTQSVKEIRACVLRGLADPSTAVPRRAAPGAVTGTTSTGSSPSTNSSPRPSSKPKAKPKPSPPPATTPIPPASTTPTPAPSTPSPTVQHLLCLEPLASLCVL